MLGHGCQPKNHTLSLQAGQPESGSAILCGMWSGKKINMVLHSRDLGAHLSTGKALNGATLTARLRTTKQDVKRVGRMPLTPLQKEAALATKLLPKVPYGIEVQPAACKPMGELSTAIVDVIGPNTRRRANAIVYIASQKAKSNWTPPCMSSADEPSASRGHGTRGQI